MTYYPAFTNAPQGTYQAPAAFAAIFTTSMFTYIPESVIINTLDVVPNYDETGGICQRTGKWYGASQLVKDGTGRIVGSDHALDGGNTWLF